MLLAFKSSVRAAVLLPAYAQNISATYAAKLVNGDFTVDLQDRAIAEAYRVAAKSMLTAYWFAKDDPTMLAVLGAEKCHTYAVLDLKDYDPNSEHQLWTTTSGAQQVKAHSILCFRSLDVTICTGGPFSQTIKRRLSNPDDFSPHQKIPRECLESPTIMHKATPSALTAGPSQLQPSDQVITLSSDDDNDNDTSITPKLRSSSSVSPTKSTKNKWPLKYACDMDKGFRKMAAKPGTRPGVFGEVFKGCQWVSSTYYDHHKAWENLSEKQIAAAVAYGRTPE
ncbi:hypothetical protein B0H17DRAFT_1145661, partial [Mycena rosella]